MSPRLLGLVHVYCISIHIISLHNEREEMQLDSYLAKSNRFDVRNWFNQKFFFKSSTKKWKKNTLKRTCHFYQNLFGGNLELFGGNFEVFSSNLQRTTCKCKRIEQNRSAGPRLITFLQFFLDDEGCSWTFCSGIISFQKTELIQWFFFCFLSH